MSKWVISRASTVAWRHIVVCDTIVPQAENDDGGQDPLPSRAALVMKY